MLKKAKRFTIKSGTGRSSISTLNAVDRAMIDASIGELNLIEVSSVLPENIERDEELGSEVGEFSPAVISKATGVDTQLAAGVAWGFREDDRGGYVMEMSRESTEIDLDPFEEELKDRLVGMGEARDVKLHKIGSVSEKMVVGEDEFGCVMTVLVFSR